MVPSEHTYGGLSGGGRGAGNEYFHSTRTAWHKIKIELQNFCCFSSISIFFTHKNVLSIAGGKAGAKRGKLKVRNVVKFYSQKF